MPHKGVPQPKGAALQEQKRRERALKKEQGDAATNEPDAHLHTAALRFHAAAAAARGHTPTLPVFHEFRDVQSMGLSATDNALFQRYIDVSSKQDPIPVLLNIRGNAAGSHTAFEFWQNSTRAYMLQCADTARKTYTVLYLLCIAEQVHNCVVPAAQGQRDDALAALFEWLRPRIPEAILQKWTPRIAQATGEDARCTRGFELLLAHLLEVVPGRSAGEPLVLHEYAVPNLYTDVFDFALVLSVFDEFSPETRAQAHMQGLLSQRELDETNPILHVSQSEELERFLTLECYTMDKADDPLYDSFSRYPLVFFPLLLRRSALPAAFQLHRQMMETQHKQPKVQGNASKAQQLAQTYHNADDPLSIDNSMMRSGFMWNPFVRAFLEFDIAHPLSRSYAYWTQFAGKEDLPCPICFEPVSRAQLDACNACTKIVCTPCVLRHQRTHSLAAPHCPHCRAVF